MEPYPILDEDLQDRATLLEQELDLPTGFLLRLIAEDDWSFVIKAHAFLEAVLTHVCVKIVGIDKLNELIKFLDMGHTKAGKIVLAEYLGIVKSREKQFLRRFLELRNLVAHDIAYVNFDLGQYMTGLSSGKAKELTTAFGYFATVFPEESLVYPDLKAFVSAKPKVSIWLSVALLVERLCREGEVRQAFFDFKRELKRDITTLQQGIKMKNRMRPLSEESET